jgi:hypothetical protein
MLKRLYFDRALSLLISPVSLNFVTPHPTPSTTYVPETVQSKRQTGKILFETL